MRKLITDTATQDGHNIALTLQSLHSGMNVYVQVFEALESKYQPFHEAEFIKAFRQGLR